MRKRGRTLLFALTLACALGMWGVCALAHSHLDSGEGYVLYNSYVAPTEDQDGTTGPGTCSVCGEVVVAAQRIPRLAKQREVNAPPDPTAVPPPATAVPTAVPTQAPPPAQGTENASSGGSGDASSQGASGLDAGNQPSGTAVTPVPEIVTPPPQAEATPVPEAAIQPVQAEATPVPAAVTQPPSAVQATPVPTPVTQWSGGSSASGGYQVTPQPDLSVAAPGAGYSAPAYSSGGSASGGASGAARGSGTQRAVSGRDLSLFPIFSSRFPWRRLRMNPIYPIQYNLAGQQVWPLSWGSSPLQNMFGY